jgi:hypothetical protein
MSATAISERAAPRERAPIESPGARLFEPRAGSLSLEDLIVGTWDELVVSGSATCPVCRGRIERTAGCTSCGSDLS